MRIASFYLVILFLAPLLLGGEYFVDNTFQGTSTGTQSKPFKTINEAMSHLQPGDTLSIRGDISVERSYPEKINLTASGTDQQPIVIRAYPGELVKIVYQSDHILKLNKDYYIIEDLIFDHDWGTNDALTISGNHNILRRCEIKNGRRDGIDIGSGDENIIENCNIHDFVHETVGNDAHGIVITGGQYNLFRYNQIFDCSGDCIQIGRGSAYHTQIIENELFTTPALQGISENAVDVKSNFGGFIYGNTMHGFRRCNGADGAALKINHQSDSMVVAWNEIYDCNGGLRLTRGDGPPRDMIVTNNVIHHLVDEGNYSVDGYGVQFDGLQNLKFYNNTFFDIPGPLFWLASNGVDSIDMRNNIFAETHSFHGDESVFHGTVHIAYNGWFNSAQIFTNQANVVTGNDPGFIDAAGADFRLRPDSPCINAGDPAFGTQYPGGRVDLGAFEFNDPTVLPEPGHAPVASRFELLKNYPNPFNSRTIIPVQIWQELPELVFEVYNILGQRVFQRIISRPAVGLLQIQWDGRDKRGVAVPSGIYLYSVRAGHVRQVQKMHLVE